MTKHLLLAGIASVFATLVLVLKQVERSERISFSMHASQSLKTYFMFATGLTMAIVFWAVWMVQWFVPQFHPGWIFTSVFFTALVLMFVAAWVRWDEGLRGKIHDFAAYRMAYLMPALPALIIMNDHFSVAVRYVYGAVLITQLVLLYQLFFIPSLHRYYLRFQLAYIALTFLALLVATYT